MQTTGAHTYTTLWPVRSQRPADPVDAAFGMKLAATVLSDLSPTAQLVVVLRSGAGRPIRAWVGFSGSEPDTEETARVFRSTLESLVPWFGLDYDDAISILPPLTASTGMAFALETRETERTAVTPKQSAIMSVTSASHGRWQITMTSGMKLADKAGDKLDFAISLIGDGPEISVAPSLLELDAVSDGPVPSIRAHHLTGDRLAEVVTMASSGQAPLSGLTDSAVVGRLMSLPLRANGPWPHVAKTPKSAEDVVSVFDGSVPPHVLTIGGSGQGKTTTQLNAVIRSARAGRATVIVDPHGDLARRAAAVFEEEGIAFRVLDFGSEDPLPWNLTIPPPGISQKMWVSILTRTIRDLWPDLGTEYVGPVWTRVVRALISILVRDPEGPHPLTEFSSLMSSDSALRKEAVARIGDQDLARIVRDEIVPMVNQRDPGNTVTWITSKLDPIIGDPTVLAIIGTDRSEVGIERVLDGEHLIVSVPTTHLTDDGARLLAGNVLNTLWLLIQRERPTNEIDLFIDEWHRVPSPTLPAMLAEGRKFGINLRLSNQNAAQINRKLWDTALANTGGLIAFRTGPLDAKYLDGLYPTIHPDALSRLPRHWVAVTTGDADFTAPAPTPIGDDDGGAALARGHKRAVVQAGAPDGPDEAEQLSIDVGHDIGHDFDDNEPRDAHPDPAELLASLGIGVSRDND